MQVFKTDYLKWFYLLLIWIGTVSCAKAAETPETLLAEAQRIFRDHPDKAIVLARQAFHQSVQKNDAVGEIKSLNAEAKFFWQLHSYDSSRVYAQNALKAAQKYRIDSLQADSWFILGLADHNLGYYNPAIEKYKKAILLYKKNNINLKIAKANLDIGIAWQQLADFSDAISYYLLAAAFFENISDQANLANTYNSIALCFLDMNNYPKSIEYHIKALNIRQKLKDTPLIAQTLGNLGLAFKKYNRPDSAIAYITRSLYMRRHDMDSSQWAAPLQDMSVSWKIKGNYKKAEAGLKRSLRIAAIYSMKEELALGNLDMAELRLAQKRYAEALQFEKMGEAIAAKFKISDLLMVAYTIRSNLYRQQNDYRNAFLYNNKSDSIRENLFSITKNKVVSELEIKYQTTQKEKDIAALKVQNSLQTKIVSQQKQSIAILVIAAALLLIAFIIAYNNFRMKNKANLRIQTLMRELNHRVKNNLQILSGLFTMQIDNLSDEKMKNALRENETRLASMNLVHNKLYLDNATTQIEMQEYLTNLLLHIKDSFGGDRERNINLKVDVEPIRMEADRAVAIGLIVNELATNAFKYAFDGNNGEIFLGLTQQPKSKLLLTLRDNGKGIANTGKKGTSFGLKLVNLMARQLNSTLVVKNENGATYQLEMTK